MPASAGMMGALALILTKVGKRVEHAKIGTVGARHAVPLPCCGGGLSLRLAPQWWLERELGLPGGASMASRQMGLAQWLGDPIAGCALQGPGNGGSEVNAVPHGHVHRLYPAPRSHGSAHGVPLVDQGRAGAALRCERTVLSDEDGLGAANGREVEQHAEVAG